MSELLFRFFFDEIRTVRIVCQNPKCGGVAEYPLSKLYAKFVNRGCCHLCGDMEFQNSTTNALAMLGAAFEELKRVQDKVRVEFALPEADKTEK